MTTISKLRGFLWDAESRPALGPALTELLSASVDSEKNGRVSIILNISKVPALTELLSASVDSGKNDRVSIILNISKVPALTELLSASVDSGKTVEFQSY